MSISPITPLVAQSPPAHRTLDRTQAKTQAEQLEATFLSMMMGYAGVGATKSSFGGGEGEAQFASFLRDAYAQEMIGAGGIGLSESIFNAMVKGSDK